jgi:hypothetical protein
MPLRRCHARDLLLQVRNYCAYRGVQLELRPDYLDRAVGAYFTALGGSAGPTSPATPLVAPTHPATNSALPQGAASLHPTQMTP